MKKDVQLRTEYGPLELEITYCDGTDCTQRGIVEYLVGWYKLSPQGINAATFGGANFADDQDFCSFACLKKVLP